MPLPNRPNILVIMSDQHSRRVLGCYGNRIVRTPNLDRLASEGLLFTDAYCPSPLCVPSRMSFMTSRFPGRNRVWDNSHILSGGIPTWAHALTVAGYETALIGRMHFVGPDQRHGFELRPIGEFGARHPGAPGKGGRWWTKYPPAAVSQSRESVTVAGRGTTAYNWFDGKVAQAACEYLSGKAKNSGRPFAAVAGFLLPHNPYIAPKELFDYYYERVDIPEVEEAQPASVTRRRRNSGLLEPLPEERVRVARAAYFGLCEQFDCCVGQVLDCLDETGLAGDTLVIYCSDHGDMAGEHGLWAKSCYYEGSAGVPLTARLPGVIDAGSVSNAVCNIMDIGPTLIDAAGAEPLHSIDGYSLWAALQGDLSAERPQKTFSEFVGLRAWPRDALPDNFPQMPSRMIRSGKWKLWLHVDEDNLPPALFDLEADPDERHDLGTDETHRDVREELLSRLREGWDPEEASRASIDATKSRSVLSAWGQAVRPECPDTLPFPDASVEADIELL